MASGLQAAEIASALAHSVFHQPYTCAEHWEGSLRGRGDLPPQVRFDLLELGRLLEK